MPVLATADSYLQLSNVRPNARVFSILRSFTNHPSHLSVHLTMPEENYECLNQNSLLWILTGIYYLRSTCHMRTPKLCSVLRAFLLWLLAVLRLGAASSAPFPVQVKSGLTIGVGYHSEMLALLVRDCDVSVQWDLAQGK